MQALHVVLAPLLKHPMFIGFLKNANAAGVTVEHLLGIGKLGFFTSLIFHASVFFCAYFIVLGCSVRFDRSFCVSPLTSH